MLANRLEISMPSPSARKLSVLLAMAALTVSFMTPSMAQSASDASTGAAAMAPAAASGATTKAQRKAARKQARAKKNAELKKLEDAGYQPGRANDQNYPQDLQNAQKKAGIGQGASQ
jgi:hypothetical protein